MKLFLALFVGLFSGTLFAKGKKYNYVIKPYMSGPTANTHVRPSSKQKSYMKEMGYDYVDQMSYGNNSDFAFGLSVSVYGLTFSYGQIELPSSDTSDLETAKGETTGEDYSFSSFGETHGFSFFSQKYKGLNLGDPIKFVPTYQEGDMLEDIGLYNSEWSRSSTSATYYFVLNDNGFSLPAMTNQSVMMQTGFAYSFIWTIGASLTELSGNGNSLMHTSQQAFYPKAGTLENIALQEINTTFGLGLSQNIGGPFAALYVGVGPSSHQSEISYLDGSKDNSTGLSYAGNALFALGYSGETAFVGMYMHYEVSQTQTDELEVDFSRGSREMYIGIRF